MKKVKAQTKKEQNDRASIKNKSTLAAIIFPIVSTIIIISLMLIIYRNYQSTFIDMEKEQLITVAQTAGQSISDFFKERLRGLDLYFSELPVGDRASNSVSSTQETLKQVETTAETRITSYIDKETCTQFIIYLSSKETEILNFDRTETTGLFTDQQEQSHYLTSLLSDGQAAAGPWYFDEQLGYIFTIFKPIIVEGEFCGVIVQGISMNDLYDALLEPIQLGEQGYCNFKDPEGYIMMHKVKTQIGVLTPKERQAEYENINSEAWDELVENQLSGDSGCDIVASYWWDNTKSGIVKKFIGYAPVSIGGQNFVLSVIRAYDEVMSPVNDMLIMLILLGIGLLGISSFFTYKRTLALRNILHLQKELELERELGEAARQLKMQKAQLQQHDQLMTLGLLTSSISHELNNLLTPTSLYCDMLIEEVEELQIQKYRKNKSLADAYQWIKDISLSIKRCNQLVSQLRTYGRRPEKQIDSSFNLSEVIKGTMNLVEKLSPQSIQVITDISNESFILNGSEGSVMQILLNLCTNAFYAMKAKSGTLTVIFKVSSCQTEDKGTKAKRQAVLLVQDTGEGMSEETLLKIFDPFFTTKGSNGTGLGLNVVKNLVEELNTDISVKSKIGEGSSFEIDFVTFG